MALRLETPKFGMVEYNPEDVVRVPGGLPGFRQLEHFLLIESEEHEPLKFLQSIDEPLISFPLIDPRIVCPDYQVGLDASDAAALGLEEPTQALIYCIVTLEADPLKSTANLRAPLVINTERMVGRQVLLSDAEYSVAEPLLRS
ncbi:MAG: flagellar assembly protein FliW [Acidobacteriota bacterium]